MITILENPITIDCTAPYAIIKTTGTTITSPNHPESYETNQYCQVTIQFPDEMRVTLIFEEFDLHHFNTDNGECEFDWLEISDGNDAFSTKLRSRLCGDNVPGPVQSRTNNLTLIFHSGEKEYDGGFRIRLGVYDIHLNTE